MLTEMTSLINSSLDYGEIASKVIEVTVKVLNVEVASLLLKDENTGELYFDVSTGEAGEKLKRIRLKEGEGIAGWVVQHGQSLIICDPHSDPRFFKKADKVSGFQTREIICTPVISKGHIIGALEGINKIEGHFDQNDLEILNLVTDHVAVAIANARLHEELKDAFYKTSHVLAQLIELRDPYTGGHTKRVHDYCVIIAESLDLPKEEVENLRLAAILHDIGKIGVKDSILLKSGYLSSEEGEIMKQHARFGAEILEPIRELQRVIPGIRNHHERYDGKGYPDGLEGKNIPLIARIIAVADTFDAMTTDRPYRKGFSREEAFAELKKFSGSQFDPEIVEAFLNKPGKNS